MDGRISQAIHLPATCLAIDHANGTHPRAILDRRQEPPIQAWSTLARVTRKMFTSRGVPATAYGHWINRAVILSSLCVGRVKFIFAESAEKLKKNRYNEKKNNLSIPQRNTDVELMEIRKLPILFASTETNIWPRWGVFMAVRKVYAMDACD